MGKEPWEKDESNWFILCDIEFRICPECSLSAADCELISAVLSPLSPLTSFIVFPCPVLTRIFEKWLLW